MKRIRSSAKRWFCDVSFRTYSATKAKINQAWKIVSFKKSKLFSAQRAKSVRTTTVHQSTAKRRRYFQMQGPLSRLDSMIKNKIRRAYKLQIWGDYGARKLSDSLEGSSQPLTSKPWPICCSVKISSSPM